jgi:hypothetical protein
VNWTVVWWVDATCPAIVPTGADITRLGRLQRQGGTAFHAYGYQATTSGMPVQVRDPAVLPKRNGHV